MAFDPNMPRAVRGGTASSVAYNGLIDNLLAVNQKNLDQDGWISSVGDPTKTRVDNLTADYVPKARKLIAGTGLTGGGDLSADRTYAVAYGTTAGTAAQGNDSRFADASSRLSTVQSYGRWHITTNQLRSAGATEVVKGWTAQTPPAGVNPIAGVTVDANGVWTFANAGVYELTFGWHASFNLDKGMGFNTNVFISDQALTIVYGQAQGYAVMYEVIEPLENSGTVYTGPVALAAGAKITLYTGFAQPVTLTGADGFKRTFFAARRIA